MATTQQDAALKSACCDTWASPIARLLLGNRLHPGGERTTALTIDSLGLEPGARVLDVGCGYGSALRLLTERGYSAIGIDLAAQTASAASTIGSVVVADAEQSPIRDGSLDGVMIECVLSLLPDKRGALSQAYRALRQGGRIAISDVAIEQPLPPTLQAVATWSNCVAGALSTDGYLRLLRESGFGDIEKIGLDHELIALIEQIRRRIAFIEIALTAKDVDLHSAGLDHHRLEIFRGFAALALDVVRNGAAGYQLFHATKQ